ncbi:MAG: Calx-beta domain-containing protein [Actinomycetota bacterium]
MDAVVPAPQRRRSSLIRLVAGTAAATVLILSLPSPAVAAPTPSVTISDVTVTEGTGAPVTASFTIQVAPPPKLCCPLQVSWSTAPGSASAPGDFTSSSGTVSLTKSATSRVIGVPIVGDTTDEVNETFVVNLTALVGAPGQIGDPQAVGTIVDNDPVPTLSANDVSVTEGNAGTTTATFTVSLSAASGKTITADWSTADGSAAQPADYTIGSGSLTFVPGDTSETLTVTVIGDVLDEAGETFTVTVSNPSNATIGDGSATGTVTDDDASPLVSIDDVSLAEADAGTSTATFTVSLSAVSGQTITVGWATGDDDAIQPSDYTTGSGTLTFVPGDTSETLGVTVNGDLVAELDEAFRVTLSAPSNATLGDATGIGTIVDDELEPVIDIDEPTAAEDTGSITFSVSLSHESDSPVTVDWSTASGTATDGPDFLGVTGTVVFPPYDTTETVSITLNTDGTFEHDETLALNLTNPTGAPIGDPQGVGRIGNDDDAPALSLGDVSVTEGNAGLKLLTFTVSLTGDTDLDATVDFASAGVTATAGTDYVDTAGTLTIPVGATSGTFDVAVNGDAIYEGDETLSVTLSDPTDGLVVDGTAVGTIRNDDKAPTTVTVRVGRTPTKLVASGILEHAQAGLRVTATLYRKAHGRFVKVTAKTVRVRDVRDRDGDDKPDGAYSATFLRPKPKGTYKVVVRFKGTAAYKPCTRSKIFTLPAT